MHYTEVIDTSDVHTSMQRCGFSVWYELHFKILAPRILRHLIDFWKTCGPLFYSYHATARVHSFQEITFYFTRQAKNFDKITPVGKNTTVLPYLN